MNYWSDKIFSFRKAVWLCWWLLPLSLGAQSTVTFEAYANEKEVSLNSYFEATFTLKNANGTEFNPPDFKGFTILSGPNTSQSMQVLNGRVSREMSIAFTLQPTRPGSFTIGSASIKANGKRLTSEPFRIDVTKGASTAGKGASPQGDVFIKVVVNKPKAWVGEQILLDYKLYTTVSINGYDIPEDPDFRGFFAQELRRYDAPAQPETVNGKQYTAKVLRRIALFPQQTGKLTVSPSTFQMTAVEDEDRSGFLFNRQVRPVIFTTDSIDIIVEPLPNDPPPTFSGAVGAWEFQASVNRYSATTDDAVSVIMIITGNGDLKRVQPPALILSDSFEVYPPKVLEEKIEENQGEITGKKVLEYLVLPRYPGKYLISPAFSWFDPRKETYVTVEQGPYFLDVKQGTDRHPAVRGDEQAAKTENDIRFIKLQTTLEKKSAAFVGTPVFWGLTAFPLLAFIGLFFYKRKTGEQSSIDPLLLKTRLANKEAQKRLATAHHHFKANDSRAFYDEVSKASLGYVCDKLNIPLSQLTKDNVQGQLQSLGVSRGFLQDFMKIIQTCEMALFAGMDNSADMQTTYEKAVAVIAGIEGEIGKR